MREAQKRETAKAIENRKRQVRRKTKISQLVKNHFRSTCWVKTNGLIQQKNYQEEEKHKRQS